jgi:hypothetical protein
MWIIILGCPILGIETKHVGIQSLCHSDMDVQFGFREKLTTSSWGQSIVSGIDKL